MRGPSSITEQLLAALQLPRVGPATVRRLARRMEDTTGADISGLLAEEFPRIPSPSAESFESATSRASLLLESCEEHGITPLSLLDPEYPQRLATIKDAPPLLYLRGDLAALSPLSLAIVGTREASEAGRQLAHRIAAAVVEQGFVVTSGLARGIDTAAHEGALSLRGRTVAVLAHGLDRITPASNGALAEELIASGGALVSEHPPGVPPYPAEYVRRNRIQSGLSVASIMVESGESGGSIHQARFTREQGRDLYVVLPKGLSEDLGFNESGGRLLADTLEAVAIATNDELVAVLREYGNSGEPTTATPEPPESDKGDGKQLEFGW